MRELMKRLIAILICANALAVVGCGGSKGFSLQSAFDGAMGPSAKELVSQAFESKDPDVQREAVTELSSHDWGLKEPYLKGYAGLLESQLSHKGHYRHTTLISAVVRALGKAGDAKYLPQILKASKAHDDNVRTDVMVALDNMVDERAVATLRNAALSDGAVSVRVAACKALGNYQQQGVLNTLIQCMDDPEFAVRYQAHETAVELAGQDFGTESAQWAGAKVGQAVATTSGKTWWNPKSWFVK